MRASAPGQILLEFATLGRWRGDRSVALRWFRAQQAHFDTSRPAGEALLELPRLFEETAFQARGGWRQRPRSHDAAMDLGQRMWSTLPGDLREEIRSGTPDSPRRVAVICTFTGMDEVPWEWLASEDGEAIATDPAIRFVRLLPYRFVAPPITIPLPLRVLLVVPNPKDERLLDPWREMATVSQSLREDQRFEVREVQEPNVPALVASLEWLPHLVHYVGHSGFDGGTGNLILRDGGGRTDWLAPAELARELPTSVRCLLLSTPVTVENYQTGGLAKFAHSPLEVSLPTVLVNQYAVAPQHAEVFWSALFRTLLEVDGDLVEAVHRARIACRNADPTSASWASFSLVIRDGIGRPMRFVSPQLGDEPLAEELQAQWAARLANELATRMDSLDAESRQSWERVVTEEATRLTELTNTIDAEQGDGV